MTFDQDAPLSRIPYETLKAHNALMDYFLMGAGRSFSKLFDQWQRIQNVPGSLPNDPPTKRFQTLKDWSAKYHWQARIAQQAENDDAIILEQRRQAQEQIIEQFRKRHMSEAEALALVADHARGNMADFAGVRAQSDLAENPQAALVKNITQHYTQTTRGTGEDKQAEIKARIALGLYDAQRALELILKHHGSFAADNKRQNLNIDMSGLTESELQRIANGEDPLDVISPD